MANPYGLLLSVRIDSTLKKALKEQGRREDLTLTQVVRKALREYLQRAVKQ
jgi:predicted transcriptional regulator